VYRSLVVPGIFIFALLVSFFLPLVSRFIPVLIPIILHWGMKGLERQADLKDKDDLTLTDSVDMLQEHEQEHEQEEKSTH